MGLKTVIDALSAGSVKSVRRVGTNADYTPGGNFNIFQIVGGPVEVEGMFGHVRVACTGALLVPLLSYFPAVTGIGGITAIAAIAAGAAHVVDTLLVWNGTLLGVLAPSVGLGHGQAGPASVESLVAGYIVFLPGTIVVVNATADATAEIDWYLRYRPSTPQSRVVPL